MLQDDSDARLTPWRPGTTPIPPAWQAYLEELSPKAKISVHHIASWRYNGQKTVNLLRSWGLPWPVVVAGALLFTEDKGFRDIFPGNLEQVVSHIHQAQHYIDCIEEPNLV